MTRILAFSALVLLFFAFEGSFFIQNSAISSYSFLFLEPSGNPQIIFGGGYIFSEALYLNRGADDGAEAGDLIVYGKNIAVGKIVEVFPKFSKVAPFSKFGEKTPLRTGDQKSVLFEGAGRGGGEISADFPNTIPINAGDGVYLAQAPSYVAGVIEYADKKEGRDFQKVSIRIPVSLNSITDVAIIKSNAAER
ncbi:MAG: rod shape-determining protein MreC [Patescibacteria group bacterium]